MLKLRIVTQEDRGDGSETQFNIFRKEANARACFKLLCDEAKDKFSEYNIEERDGQLYVDDVYIYIEIFSTYLDDKDRESGDLYSNLRNND